MCELVCVRVCVCMCVCVTRLSYKRIGARGVVVIAVGNEHGDTSSNPGRY